MKQLLRTAILIGAAGIGLGGCASYNRGYYGGVEVGAGYGGGYYEPGYWDYGPGYYGGWYDGFYYPGGGIYVFDRGGHRHQWTDAQRAYWQAHGGEHHWQGRSGFRSGQTGSVQTGQALNANPVRPGSRSGFRSGQGYRGGQDFHGGTGFHGGMGARGVHGGFRHR